MITLTIAGEAAHERDNRSIRVQQGTCSGDVAVLVEENGTDGADVRLRCGHQELLQPIRFSRHQWRREDRNPGGRGTTGGIENARRIIRRCYDDRSGRK